MSLGLEKTEEEVFSLAKEEKYITLIDDIHAARIAQEKLKLMTKPSLYLLLLLYKKHKIKKEELIEDIKSLLKYRNWLSGALWEYAMNMIDNI
jgi:predicted nucleic acid-binding protein